MYILHIKGRSTQTSGFAKRKCINKSPVQLTLTDKNYPKKSDNLKSFFSLNDGGGGESLFTIVDRTCNRAASVCSWRWDSISSSRGLSQGLRSMGQSGEPSTEQSGALPHETSTFRCSRSHSYQRFYKYGKIGQLWIFACTVHLAARSWKS